MISLFFALVCFIFLELKLLDFIYLFQIKEYRFDRFAAMIKDAGFIPVFFSIKNLPAKTVRNMIAACIGTSFIVLWIFLIYPKLPFVIASTILYWAISFLATLTGIYITHIPSFIRKKAVVMLAAQKRKELPVTVIGITGSFGKTTTKEYLFEILSKKFNTVKTPHNLNTDIGVALTVIRDLTPRTQFFIAEMGAYRPGEIQDICRFARPRYAILTGIGNQHLHLFGTKERLTEAKKELLLSLPKNGKAYINADRSPSAKLTAGLRAPAVLYRNNQTDSLLRNMFLPSEIIRENLVPCILLARELGLTDKEILSGIAAIKNNRQRLTPVTGRNRATVIDNSYNTNLEGFLYSIKILAGRKEKNKIIVSRGIIELGNEKQKTYDRILHDLHTSDIFLYTTDEDFAVYKNPNVRLFQNEESMENEIITKMSAATVILIEGRFHQKFIRTLKGL